jgi:hypothetical protein
MEMVLAASDYPLLNVFWSILFFFLWVIWFWLLISVFSDIFRRHDLSGVAKAGWLVFTILLPYLGVFVYLITQSKHMAERRASDAQAAQAQFDEHVRAVASSNGAAAEIQKAKQLLDNGAITQPEFDAIKQKALA